MRDMPSKGQQVLLLRALSPMNLRGLITDEDSTQDLITSPGVLTWPTMKFNHHFLPDINLTLKHLLKLG